MACRRAAVSLLALPDDIIYEILSFCDGQTLGRIACCCRRLNWLSCQDCVWLRRFKALPTKICPRNENTSLLVKEEYKLAKNWTNGHFTDTKVIYYQEKQLPWLQLTNNTVWISNKNKIEHYRVNQNGNVRKSAGRILKTPALQCDVTRFKEKSNFVVCGTSAGDIYGFSCSDSEVCLQWGNCHTSDIHDVDFYNDTIVSGSRDTTIKVWLMNEGANDALQYTIDAGDRVWSVAISPAGNYFAAGSAGLNHVPPLRLWDLESGMLLGDLGSEYKNGAGVLDIQFENPHILLSGGYDTYIRMWDLRASYTECVCNWEEPFDSTIYTLRTDGNNSILGGTSRHALVQLWDKRRPNAVQHYFVGRSEWSNSSPVFSLDFNQRYMYVALDRGLHCVDFTL